MDRVGNLLRVEGAGGHLMDDPHDLRMVERVHGVMVRLPMGHVRLRLVRAAGVLAGTMRQVGDLGLGPTGGASLRSRQRSGACSPMMGSRSRLLVDRF
jgi:hypothetical protein